MTLAEVAQSALYLGLLVALGFLGPKVAALVEKTGGKNASAILQIAAEVGVKAAEQIYGKGDADVNKTKLAYAQTAAKAYLDSRGVDSSNEALYAAIEAAVLQMKRTIPGPMELSLYSDALSQPYKTSEGPTEEPQDSGVTTGSVVG